MVLTYSPIHTPQHSQQKIQRKKNNNSPTEKQKDSKAKQQTPKKKTKKNASRHRYKKFTSLSLARIHLDEHPKCSQRSQEQHQVPLRIYECELNSATGYKLSAQTIVRVDVRYIYLLTCAL